jgi:hypothetical protein
MMTWSAFYFVHLRGKGSTQNLASGMHSGLETQQKVASEAASH